MSNTDQAELLRENFRLKNELAAVQRKEALRLDELQAMQRAQSELKAEVSRLRLQLPEGMQDCTIRFKKCEKGHGWLTADNWEPFGCPTCEVARLTERLRITACAADNATAHRKTVEAEVARLREDKERLDWVEQKRADLFEAHDEWYVGFVGIESKTASPTVRGAIDAARKAGGGK